MQRVQARRRVPQAQVPPGRAVLALRVPLALVVRRVRRLYDLRGARPVLTAETAGVALRQAVALDNNK